METTLALNQILISPCLQHLTPCLVLNKQFWKEGRKGGTEEGKERGREVGKEWGMGKGSKNKTKEKERR